MADVLDLEGLTKNDCPDACTEECCIITGCQHVKFEDGTMGWWTHCGHPAKSGLQAVHQMMPQVKKNYAAAKHHLKALAAAEERTRSDD
jgi:hypothetical protein